MASITASRRPISRYRAPVGGRDHPPIPPQWLTPAGDFRAPPPLAHFVLLSLLLHALSIVLFGAPSGGSREGRAMWGAMQVELRGLLIEPARTPSPTQGIEPLREAEATPAPSRQDRGAAEGAVPMTPPAETQAAAVAPSGPAIVEVPTPFPRLLDRLVRPETRLVDPPALVVPLPTEGRDLRPPPRERPPPAPVAVPEPMPLAPATPSERALAEPPAIEIPLALPQAPVAAPPIASPPAEAPAPAAPPITRPVESPAVEVRTIPVLPLESIAPPADAAVAIELAPLPQIQAPPAPPPVERFVPRLGAPDAPASPPLPGDTTPGSRLAPGTRREETGRRPDDPTAYDPTAPSLDLDAIRSRAGQIAREGSGQRAILPFPMPPVPERKSTMEAAIENARKPDCRTAYQGLGLAAIVPLIANEFGEGKCRW